MKTILLLVLALSVSTSGLLHGQTYYRLNATNDGTTVNFTCPITNTRFADEGNNSTHYAHNSDYTITFCAPAGQLLQFDFGCGSNLTIERIDPSDVLYIYDGPSTTSPLLYEVTGNPSNSDRLTYFGEDSDFRFVSPSECITFRLVSDAANNNDGWDACISCVAPVNCGSNEPASDLFGGAPYVCNLEGYCGTTSGDFGADFPVDLNQSGGSCPSTDNFLGTIQNNSWLRFIASSTNVTFDFNVPLGGSCINGIQTAIFSYDGTNLTRLSDCSRSDGSHAGSFQLTGSGLTPGDTYYLMVDGNAGDVCDYTINANSGVETVGAGPDQTICPGDDVNLSATGPGGTYTWNALDGSVTNAVGRNQTFTPGSTTTYEVELTSSSTCEAESDQVLVTVGCTVLNAELLSFEALNQGQEVALSWVIEELQESAHAEIQRSINGWDWEPIDLVDLQPEERASYSTLDETPLIGLSYYRLKLLLNQQPALYSAVKAVERDGSDSALLTFPNPVAEVLQIKDLASNIRYYRIYDSLGQLRISGEASSANELLIRIDVSSLASGTYFLQTNLGTKLFQKL